MTLLESRLNNIMLPTFVVIGNVIPILHGARDVTAFFMMKIMQNSMLKMLVS
jgi:hypothetical protein